MFTSKKVLVIIQSKGFTADLQIKTITDDGAAVLKGCKKD